MADQRTIENKLKWTQDNQSAQSVIQSNKQIAASFSDLRKEADTAYQARVAQLQAEQALKAAYTSGDAAAIAQAQANLAQSAQLTADAARATVAAQEQEAAAAKAALVTEQQITAEVTKQVEATKTRANVIRDIGFQKIPEPAFGAFAGETGSGVSPGSRLGSLRQAAIALPGVGFQSPIVLGLRAAEAAANKTGASFLELGATGALLGAGLVALKIAFDAFNKGIEDSKKVLTGGLSAQTNYFNAVRDLTTEQVTEEIASRKRQRDLQVAQIEETQNAINSAFQQAQAAFGDAVARALDAGGKLPTAQLREQLDELNKAYQENDQTITRLTQGVDANAFALNDATAAAEAAAEAEKKLAEEREKAAQDLIEQFQQEADLRLSLSELRRSGTSEQLAAFFDSNNDQIAIIRNFLIPAVEGMGLSTEAAAEKTAELTDQLHDLEHANELAFQSVKPIIEQREREAKLAQDLIDQSDELNQGLQELADLQLKLGEASAKSSESYKELLLAQQEHDQNLRDIEIKRGEDIADIRRKVNQRIEQIDAQSTERLLQQRENDTLSIEAAVARGDIAAAQQILAQQKLRIEQEKRQVQEQKDNARADGEERIAAANEQAERLLKSEQERYDKEYQQRVEAHARDLAAEKALLNQIEAQRAENAFKTQYWNNIIQQSYDALGGATERLAQRVNAAAGSMGSGGGGFFGGLGRGIGSAIGSVGSFLGSLGTTYLGSFGGSYSPLPPVSGTAARGGRTITFDSGGVSTRPGWYYAGIPEMHIPLTDKRSLSSAGGTTLIFPITVPGDMDEEKFRRLVREEVLPRVENAKVEVVSSLAEINRRANRHV